MSIRALPHQHTLNVIAAASPANNPLTSKGVTDGLTAMSAAAATIQAYTTALRQQAPFSLGDVVPNLSAHLTLAQTNAKKWNEVLVPQIQLVNRDIVGFGTNFNSYYDPLVAYAKQILDNPNNRDAVNNFRAGLTELDTIIVAKKTSADGVAKSINDFQVLIIIDAQNFDADNAIVVQKITGTGGELDILKKEIAATNDRISRDIGFIAGGAALAIFGGLIIAVGVVLLPTGLGVGVLVAGIAVAGIGAAGIIGGAIDLAKAKKDLAAKVEKQAQLQQQVTGFTLVSGQITALRDHASAAVTALGTVSQGWSGLSKQFQQLNYQLENNVHDASPFLLAQLDTAKAEWSQALTMADGLLVFGSSPAISQNAADAQGVIQNA